MKIAIDCRIIESKELFGPQRSTVELLRELFRIDSDNEYILFFHSEEVKDFVMSLFSDIEGKCTTVIVPFGLRGLRNFLYMSGVIQRFAPDVYYVPFYFINPLISRKCRVVITIYDLIPFLYPNPKMSFLNKLFHRSWIVPYLMFLRATSIVTCSDHTTKDLIKRFRVSPEKIHRIYLGATHSVSHIDPAQAKSEVLAQFGISHPYLLYVGRNEPHKNIRGIIRAYYLLPQFIRDRYHLVIGGKADTKFSMQLQELVNNLGLVDQVHFIGFVEQGYLSALYSAAEVFVFVSHYEGFGIPILEAFMCRTPVIASRSSCLPEVAGEAALYADPGDVKKISLNMHSVLGNALLRQQLIDKGTEQLKRFSWKKAAQELLRVLQGEAQ